MKTYYLAALIAMLILSSTFFITSWGAIRIKTKMFIRNIERSIVFMQVKAKRKHRLKYAKI